MSDNLTADQRKKTMASVKSQDSKAEMAVRRMAHALGFRFRLHRKDLPGKPDLVFPRLKKVIFVHGCFWHVHEGCRAAKRPASNTVYWDQKLRRNKERDRQNMERLVAAGWRPFVVWECETRNPEELKNRIAGFLSDGA